jgi:CBS domain-containing protein
MTVGVVTASPDETVATALQRMIDHDIGAVVVAEGETPVGVFTERDVTRRVLTDPDLLSRRVGEVMSSPVVTTGPDEEIVTVFETMTARKIRRLPVVEGGQLVGILTERDLLRWVDAVAKE